MMAATKVHMRTRTPISISSSGKRSIDKKFNAYRFLIENKQILTARSKDEASRLCNEIAREVQGRADLSRVSSTYSLLKYNAYACLKDYPASSQRMRMRQIEDWEFLKRQGDAATKIQKHIRRHLARKKFIEMVHKAYVEEATPSAVGIQKYWRKFVAIKTTKSQALVTSLRSTYGHNFALLTRYVKGWSIQRNVRFYAICHKILRTVFRAACRIQAWHKMRHTRSRYIEILQYERAYTSVRWIHGAKSEVSLVGSFTVPEWKVFLRMEFCSLRGVYVKYLANLKEGEEYSYSFVVDGQSMVHRKKFIAGRAQALGDMKINTFSSSRTSKWEEKSIATPPKPESVLTLPPGHREENPNIPPPLEVPSLSAPANLVMVSPVVPELAAEEKEESKSEELMPAIIPAENKPAEEAVRRIIMATEYKTPTTETENKSDKTSSMDRGNRWNPEEEFASFPISKRENEDNNNPPLFGKEERKLQGGIKDMTPEFGIETLPPEDAEEKARQRELIEKDRVSGGRADINFDMAFDYVPDDYYSQS